MSLSAEGRIRLEFGFSDYGQNLAEAITCLVCETLGCVAGDIDVVLGNSRGPDSGPTSASRSSVLIHGVLADILPRWKDRVRDQAAVLTGLPCDQLYSGPGGLFAGGRQVLSYRELAEKGQPEQTRLMPVRPFLLLRKEINSWVVTFSCRLRRWPGLP